MMTVSCFVSRVLDFRFRVSGFGFQVWEFGFRIKGLGFRIDPRTQSKTSLPPNERLITSGSSSSLRNANSCPDTEGLEKSPTLVAF